MLSSGRSVSLWQSLRPGGVLGSRSIRPSSDPADSEHDVLSQTRPATLMLPASVNPPLVFCHVERPGPAKSGGDMFGTHFQEQMLPGKRERARRGGGRPLSFRGKPCCLHFDRVRFLPKGWAETGAVHHGRT